ncbi:MAG TPA: helix-turn-helix domain-containing protein, partial [Chloroflexota bacterium]|nr:helix-turn-helix domain-containing protein [Chloroflexota bacterium]
MQLINEDYLSVAEAAELLKVAKSTIWRWINQGDLPAYRFGHRHVLINQKDLSRLIAPARAEKGKEILEHERQRLSSPMTGDEQEKALAAIDAAERFSRRLR